MATKKKIKWSSRTWFILAQLVHSLRMDYRSRPRSFTLAFASLGGTLEKLAEIRAEMEKIETQEGLRKNECPECGAKLTRVLDTRQIGAECIPPTDGDWFNYRCECGFMVDRKESKSVVNEAGAN